MSDETPVEDDTYYEGGRAGAPRRSAAFSGCLAVLVALAVIVGGFYFVVTKGVDWVSDQFSSAEDYPGPGSGSVTFEVDRGRRHRRDRSQPQGRGRRGLGGGLHSTPRPPTPTPPGSRSASTR